MLSALRSLKEDCNDYLERLNVLSVAGRGGPVDIAARERVEIELLRDSIQNVIRGVEVLQQIRRDKGTAFSGIQ